MIKFFLNLGGKFYISEKMLWLYRWHKPVKPYAFIRVHNEIKTIDASLKSILPVVKGGVIGFHHSDDEDDGTKEYVLAFCKKYPQFIPVEYPHKVIPASSPKYKNKDLDIRRRLDSYYNFVWDKLPKNEWIIKVDCDHIYHPNYVEDLCRLLLRKKDAVVLSRMNLHCYNNQVYVRSGEGGIMEPEDHWILYNGEWIPKSPFIFHFVNNEKKFQARETFKHIYKCNKIYSILSNWHFQRIKTRRSHFHLNDFILLKDSGLSGGGGVQILCQKFKNRIPADMIDEEKILATYYSFNLEEKKILP